MDDPNITMAEYIQLEEEKARRRGQTFNWETATYGKIWYDEYVHYLRSFEDKLSAIVYNYALTSEPEVSYDFENEFPAIVYNDALTSEPEVSSKPTVSAYPAIKVDFDFVISFDESDDEDYTCIYDKNLFSYKLVSINDLKSDSGNDDIKINLEQYLRDLSIKPLPNVIKIDTQGSNELSETSHDTISKIFTAKFFIKELNVNIMTCNFLNKGISLILIIQNLSVPFGIPFDPKLFYKDGIKLGQV
ncbi:hypothetical protein Tco_1159800 [Tanacetum coccineum]